MSKATRKRWKVQYFSKVCMIGRKEKNDSLVQHNVKNHWYLTASRNRNPEKATKGLLYQNKSYKSITVVPIVGK